MKIYRDIEQGTPAWTELRRGKFTATDFKTIMTGREKTIRELCYKKAAEIITGKKIQTTIRSRHIDRGHALEPKARDHFSFMTGLEVEQVGFVEMSQFIGCSPDGLVGDDSGIEIKSKDDHTHMDCLLHGDDSYMWQIYGNMLCSNRHSWHFVSYNENFPMKYRMYHKLWEWDDKSIGELSERLDFAVGLLQGTLEDFSRLEIDLTSVGR